MIIANVRASVNDMLDDILAESGDEEEEQAVIDKVLDEIGIEISGQVNGLPLRFPRQLASVFFSFTNDDYDDVSDGQGSRGPRRKTVCCGGRGQEGQGRRRRGQGDRGHAGPAEGLKGLARGDGPRDEQAIGEHEVDAGRGSGTGAPQGSNDRDPDAGRGSHSPNFRRRIYRPKKNNLGPFSLKSSPSTSMYGRLCRCRAPCRRCAAGGGQGPCLRSRAVILSVFMMKMLTTKCAETGSFLGYVWHFLYLNLACTP